MKIVSSQVRCDKMQGLQIRNLGKIFGPMIDYILNCAMENIVTLLLSLKA